MSRTTLIALALAVSGSTASAATMSLDLTDNIFVPGSVAYSFGPIQMFEKTAGGVTFSFTASGSFKQIGTWENGTTQAAGPWALDFGGGSGSPQGFSFSVDQNISLIAYEGFRFNALDVLPAPIFAISGTGVNSVGNTFPTTGAGSLGIGTPSTIDFAGEPLTLLAGSTYQVTTTNAGATTLGYLTAFNFALPTPAPAPIPLPAGGLLLLSALGGLAIGRRRAAA
jgi:hypothetical protein